MSWNILQGDALDQLRTLPDESVHCVVTSPPYYGLRDYGVDGQIGLEPTMQEYVAKLVNVFRGVRRVLRDDGTCWINLGDSYVSQPGQRKATDKAGPKQLSNRTSCMVGSRYVDDLKPKDLIGIPWRVVFALQDDGWWLRSDIIWAKPNPMPESVTDRPTKAHEYIFLLTKSPRYFFDQEAVREPHVMRPQARLNGHKRRRPGPLMAEHIYAGTQRSTPGIDGNPAGRNMRTVWTIATEPYRAAHFATFPTALAERCIKAGTSEKGCCELCGKPWVRIFEKTNTIQQNAKGSRFDTGKTFGRTGGDRIQKGERFESRQIGWQPSCSCDAPIMPCTVLDPFAGSGTTLLVADRLGRHGIGIELSADYCQMARDRLAADAPLLNFAAGG